MSFKLNSIGLRKVAENSVSYQVLDSKYSKVVLRFQWESMGKADSNSTFCLFSQLKLDPMKMQNGVRCKTLSTPW